jgi:NADP-dependent 3-hydroxy acid dehydrogenase YdfG
LTQIKIKKPLLNLFHNKHKKQFLGHNLYNTPFDMLSNVIFRNKVDSSVAFDNDHLIPGARVIVACRNLDKANEAVADIKKQCANCENVGEMHVTKLDLTSLNSVRICAKTILESEGNINLLINNAGVMMCPESRTEDDFEMQFGTNHLGHFLLTMLLLPKICQSTPARIVNVSSVAHKCKCVNLSVQHKNQIFC